MCGGGGGGQAHIHMEKPTNLFGGLLIWLVGAWVGLVCCWVGLFSGFGWLVGLVGWFDGCWLVGLVGCLVRLLVGWVGWLVGWLVGCRNGCNLGTTQGVRVGRGGHFVGLVKKYKGPQWESATPKNIVTKKVVSGRMSLVSACTAAFPLLCLPAFANFL